MDKETTPSMGERLWRLVQHFWQNRDIIIRSDGRVRYISLSRQIQLIGLILVLGGGASISWFSIAIMESRTENTENERKINHTQAKNQQLMAEIGDYERKFSTVLRELETNEAYLINVLEQNSVLQKQVALKSSKQKNTQTKNVQMGDIRTEQIQKNKTYPIEHQTKDKEIGPELYLHNKKLEAKLETMQRDFSALKGQHESLLKTRDQLARRVEAFQSRVRLLASAKAERERALNSLRDELVGTRARLSGDVALAESEAQRRLNEMAALHSAQMAKQRRELEQQLKTTRVSLQKSLTNSQQARDHLSQKQTHLTHTLEATEVELAMVLAEKNRLHASLGEQHEQIMMMQSDQQSLIAERNRAAERMQASEQAMAKAINHNILIEQQLESTETALHGALEERGETAAANHVLEERVATMQHETEQLNAFHLQLLQQVEDRTRDSIGWLEATLKRTGLDLEKMIAAASSEQNTGQGGPFQAFVDNNFPAPIEKTAARIESDIERWEDIQKLLATLPLNAPVDYGHVSSGFGKRKDPINGKMALHKGVDISAPSRTPVLATADGLVTKAGWNGTYGKFIEIKHGLNIKTRYAHMSKIYVKKGEKIKYRHKIGLVGSSGRSTGPHVHYEISIGKKHLNPSRFLSAGRHVFKN